MVQSRNDQENGETREVDITGQQQHTQNLGDALVENNQMTINQLICCYHVLNSEENNQLQMSDEARHGGDRQLPGDVDKIAAR